jgi:hypothetical protein
MLAAAGLAQSAAAQSWGYGPPGLYGPPVVFYDPRFAVPPGYYGQPGLAVPRGRLPQAPTIVSPDAVFDRLEDAGYSQLSPMAPRGEFYKLTAVDPAGNLVGLEVSIFTGSIENSYILEAGVRVPPAPVEPKRKRVRAPAALAPLEAAPAERPAPTVEPAALPRPRPNPEPAQAAAPPPPAVDEPTQAVRPMPPAAAEPAQAAAPPSATAAVEPTEEDTSTLRSRLLPPPEETEDGDADPLVVY